METAPTGVISTRAFCDTIMDMTALTVRTLLLHDFNRLSSHLGSPCWIITQVLEITKADGTAFALAYKNGLAFAWLWSRRVHYGGNKSFVQHH